MYKELIERLSNLLQSYTAYTDPDLAHTLGEAMIAIATLKSKNAKLEEKLKQETLAVLKVLPSLNWEKVTYDLYYDPTLKKEFDFKQRVIKGLLEEIMEG